VESGVPRDASDDLVDNHVIQQALCNGQTSTISESWCDENLQKVKSILTSGGNTLVTEGVNPGSAAFSGNQYE
jgi:hypothetical protein